MKVVLGPLASIQCPECGAPVDAVEGVTVGEGTVLLRAEPCLHEWEERPIW